MAQTPSQINKLYKKNNPWAEPLFAARQRCNNPNSWAYKYYGGRGIKCLVTIKDMREIWMRDGADNMKCPSIDRIDNDGDYTIENCRFIEKSENTKRSNIENPRWITKSKKFLFKKGIQNPVVEAEIIEVKNAR